MKTSAIKLAPTLAVLAMAGYCCWLESDEPAAKQAGKKSEFTLALLSPAAVPAPGRDPFQAAETAALNEKPGPNRKEPAVPAKNATSPEARPAAGDLSHAVSGLALRATFLRGSRRLALINDRLYAEGEALVLSKAAEPPYVVAQVHADKVILQHGEDMVELKYPERGTKTKKP